MRMVRLGDVCDIRIGRTPTRANPDFWGGPHAWATISDLNDPVTTTRQTVSDRAVVDLRLRPVKPGTLLYSFKLTIGKMAFAGRELFTNEAIAAFTPRDDTVLDRHYLRVALQTIDGAADAVSAVKGRTLNSKSLAEIRIPAPALSDQRRIAEALDRQGAVVDSLRATAIGRAEAARQIRRRLIDAAFPVDGIWRLLGSVARIQVGYAFESRWFRPEGIRLLRNANVQQDRIDWGDAVLLDRALAPRFSQFRLAVGDVVLSLDRPIVAGGLKVARVRASDLPALLVQRVARFLPGALLDEEYVYWYLHTAAFLGAITAHAQSVAVPHVSPKQVAAVEIPLPSIDEQRRIAAELRERLATNDAMTRAIEAQLEAIDALPAALLRRAFEEVETA